MGKIILAAVLVVLVFSAQAFAGPQAGAVFSQSGAPASDSNAARNVVAAAAVAIMAVAVYSDGKRGEKVSVYPTDDAKGAQVKLTKTF